MKKVAIVIPARKGSTRFSGKLMETLCEKPVIEWVVRNCSEAANIIERVLDSTKVDVYVATDDIDIETHVRELGLSNVLLESVTEDCETGTDRVYKAINNRLSSGSEYECVVNVQGDEPFVTPDQISEITIEWFQDHNDTAIFCGMTKIDSSLANSKSVPKVAFDEDGLLVYMSRAPVPASKGGEHHERHDYYRQVCVYVFRWDALKYVYGNNKKTRLESIEDIEILRCIESGEDVQMWDFVGASDIAIDHPKDIARAEEYIAKTALKDFQYDCWFFDCDGVLLDSNKTKSNAFYEVALEVSKDESIATAFQEYHEANGGISRYKKFRYFLTHFIEETDDLEARADKLCDVYGKKVQTRLCQVAVQPMIKPLLDCIMSSGSDASVVSGGEQSQLEYALSYHGLLLAPNKYFSRVSGSPRTKSEIISGVDIDGKRCVFVGDSRYDYETAKEFGMDFIFLSGWADGWDWESFFKDKPEVMVYKDIVEMVQVNNKALL